MSTPPPSPAPAERELTEPVSLTYPSGRLNPDAVGWARAPIVDTWGIGRIGSIGRNKRWEYWNVITPRHIAALTVSSLDYAAVHEVWVMDRQTQQTWGRSTTAIPARGVELPAALGDGPATARARDLEITITPSDGTARWRLQARIPGAAVDVTVSRPPQREVLAVVVPWSERRFQYTVKAVGLPACGTITLDGVSHEVPHGSWAVLDHGRGRWPYHVRWNWGAGAGLVGGEVFGIQVGGQWTDGTGMTENGVLLGDVMHKISEPLTWTYDVRDWRRPWRVRGGGLDATFEPSYNKSSATNLGVITARTDQCFGTWSGTFRSDAGGAAAGSGPVEVEFAGIEGFAEDVHNRW